jgi:hypothetical protein
MDVKVPAFKAVKTYKDPKTGAERYFSCTGFKHEYQPGVTYKFAQPLVMYSHGFHGCTVASECFKPGTGYKTSDTILHVLLGGSIVYDDTGKTMCADTIEIGPPLSREERAAQFAAHPVRHRQGSFWYDAWYDADGNLHRETGEPAVVHYWNHYKAWFRHGLPHREGGLPAFEMEGGTRKYFWMGTECGSGTGPETLPTDDSMDDSEGDDFEAPTSPPNLAAGRKENEMETAARKEYEAYQMLLGVKFAALQALLKKHKLVNACSMAAIVRTTKWKPWSLSSSAFPASAV